jgi:hypothetical protein
MEAFVRTIMFDDRIPKRIRIEQMTSAPFLEKRIAAEAF